ncbi:MAG: hypothetical protein IKZ42_07275 [Clostridiales bacterium]|nr:hypothetical protein [Clostridiales bacterium]
MRSKFVKNLVPAFVSILLAALFSALYSLSTSPLLDGYWGEDSAFFILVGQGMTKGLLPYRDFFDMKGPYLYFIQFIGQKICYGRIGAYIVQTVNFSVCFFLMGKISDLFSVKRVWLHRTICYILSILIMAVTIQDGNLTEEYSLPAILICLYFCLKYFKEAEEKKVYKHPLYVSLINGAAVGFISLIKITNAATIGAILVTVYLFMLAKKEIKNALLNLCSLMAGFFTAFAIPCIFFYSKHLLREMLYQVFVFGFAYSAEVSFTHKFINVFTQFRYLTLFLILPVVICFIYREKWYIRLLSILSALMILLAVTMGNAYLHYFTLLVPHIILGLAVAFRNSRGRLKFIRNAAAVICCVLVLSFNYKQISSSCLEGATLTVASQVYASTNGGETSARAKKFLSIPYVTQHTYKVEWEQPQYEIAALIPDSEKRSVFCFGDKSWARWYGQTQTLPANRYMHCQAHYMKMFPGIEDELASWINNDGPVWVITPVDGTTPSQKVTDAITANYEHVFENRKFHVFHRISQ